MGVFDESIENDQNRRLQFEEERIPITPRAKCTPCTSIYGRFSDYSANTTIHGVKYLGERKRPIAEKIWWLLGFILCIGCLFYFIRTIYIKWEKSPVIMVVDDSPTPIYKIPFPAVTICPENKMRSNLFNYTSTFKRLCNNETAFNVTEQDVKYFEAMSHVCEYENYLITNQDIWEGKEHMDKSFVEAIEEVSLPFEDVIFSCLFQNKTNCTQIFSKILTEDGICFTFNLMTEMYRNETIQNDYKYFQQNKPIANWDPHKGYLNGELENVYPIRSIGMGKRHALTILLISNDRDITFSCRGSEQGYKVTFHSPIVYPQPYKNFHRVQHGRESTFEIKPKIITTSDSLRSYSPHRRQCYFDNERHLRFYRDYNEMNCKLECIANLTFQECGCVKFSLPRGQGIPICGATKIPCFAPIFNEAENDVLKKQFDEEYFGKNSEAAKRFLDECDCLPDCNSIEYEADEKTIDFDYKQTFKEFGWAENETSIKMSIVTIYFQSTKFLGTTRSELYGFSDLVSNFGGLLGLFMGGSILSLVEILYFCTIRRCSGASHIE